MTLHVPTILLTSAMMNALIAALQMFVSQRIQSRALGYWAWCNIAVASGGVFLGLRGTVPLVASVILGNGLLFFGLGLVVAGVRIFDGQPPRLKLVFGVAGLGTALLAVSLAQGDNLGERVIIASLVICGWCLLAAFSLSHRPPRDDWSVARSICTGLLGLMACLYGLRAIGVAVGMFSAESAHMGPQQALLVLASLALGISWNFCSLYMVLDRLASTDELTGLLNRRTTLRRGRQVLDDALLRGRAMSVLMLDLDHFKSINDRFGHHVGDAVLRHFAETAARALRAGDVIGRLGGEEFCVILPGADTAAAEDVGERLRQIAELELKTVVDLPVNATVTVGVASLPPDAPHAKALGNLMRAADEALYTGKSEGRNRVSTAHPRGEMLTPMTASSLFA